MNFIFSSAKKSNPSTVLNRKMEKSAMEETIIKACPLIIRIMGLTLLITGSIAAAKYGGNLFGTPQNMYEHLIQRV